MRASGMNLSEIQKKTGRAYETIRKHTNAPKKKSSKVLGKKTVKAPPVESAPNFSELVIKETARILASRFV